VRARSAIVLVALGAVRLFYHSDNVIQGKDLTGVLRYSPASPSNVFG
jgi:hypothetical protein